MGKTQGFRPKLLRFAPPVFNPTALFNAAGDQGPGTSPNAADITPGKSNVQGQDLVTYVDQMGPHSAAERSYFADFVHDALAHQEQERLKNPRAFSLLPDAPPRRLITAPNASEHALPAPFASFTPLAVTHTTAVAATFLAQTECRHAFSPSLLDHAEVTIPSTPPGQIRKGPEVICSCCGFAPAGGARNPPPLQRARGTTAANFHTVEDEEKDSGPKVMDFVRCAHVGCGLWRCGGCVEEREDVGCGEEGYFREWVGDEFGGVDDEEMEIDGKVEDEKYWEEEEFFGEEMEIE